MLLLILHYDIKLKVFFYNSFYAGKAKGLCKSCGGLYSKNVNTNYGILFCGIGCRINYNIVYYSRNKNAIESNGNGNNDDDEELVIQEFETKNSTKTSC